MADIRNNRYKIIKCVCYVWDKKGITNNEGTREYKNWQSFKKTNQIKLQY